ncbi:hypothetical protein BJF81_12360 [Ornithinimicrobium sp. CNJ-824]|nr:hypothetical protein BJF81_12360 [Ornithinimicrobium sp. CNJ-824]
MMPREATSTTTCGSSQVDPAASGRGMSVVKGNGATGTCRSTACSRSPARPARPLPTRPR